MDWYLLVHCLRPDYWWHVHIPKDKPKTSTRYQCTPYGLLQVDVHCNWVVLILQVQGVESRDDGIPEILQL